MPQRRSRLRRQRRPHQKQLGLSARGQWGGYRAGAGRPAGRSDHYVPHVPRPRVTRHHAVHVTLRCVDGLPSLRRQRPAALIQRIFSEEGRRKGFRLAHYAIRGNHLHLVCEADDTLALSRGVQRVASRIARTLNRHFARRGRFFGDRFHGRVISTPKDMRHVLRYVYLNEHKDKAAIGELVRGLDPYTSHRWFDGWAHHQAQHHARLGRPPPPTPADPVTAPRSWLLRIAWRRHGLIRSDEIEQSARRARRALGSLAAWRVGADRAT